MAYVIKTRDKDGIPICPMCQTRVEEQGAFCTAICYQDFHVMIYEYGDDKAIEMDYLTLGEQPWYGVDHG